MNIALIFKKKGYGKFPYIIMRVKHGIYIQIPIHLLKKDEKVDIINQPGTQIHVDEDTLSKSKEEQIASLHDRLIHHTKLVKAKTENERDFLFGYCLVEGKEKAYYFKNGNINYNKSIPTGGKLLTQENEIIAWNHPHYWYDD